MITENIAKDAVLLISKQMSHIKRESISLIRNTQVEDFKRAYSLWNCIKTEFHKTEVASAISQDLENTPVDEIVQAIFRHQLSKHLKKDADFAWDVEQILYVQDFKTPIRRMFVQGNTRITDLTEINSPQAVPMTLIHSTNSSTQNSST